MFLTHEGAAMVDGAFIPTPTAPGRNGGKSLSREHNCRRNIGPAFVPPAAPWRIPLTHVGAKKFPTPQLTPY
jgi:hypothetical protein